MRGRERRQRPEQWLSWQGSMGGGKELTGERGTRPTGHGLRIREHRGIAGVHATSARPRRWPEERVKVAVAMAGDAELTGVSG